MLLDLRILGATSGLCEPPLQLVDIHLDDILPNDILLPFGIYAGFGDGRYGGNDSEARLSIEPGVWIPSAPATDNRLLSNSPILPVVPSPISPPCSTFASLCNSLNSSSSSSAVLFRPIPKLISPSIACIEYLGNPSCVSSARQTPRREYRRSRRTRGTGTPEVTDASLLSCLRRNVGNFPCFRR